MLPEDKFMTRDSLAASLGISYTTLYRKLKKLGISIPKGLLNEQDQKAILSALGFQTPDENNKTEDIREEDSRK